jgi:DNA-binding transcriptional regulator YiaG
MANIAQVLKEEIARVSRKEAKKLLEKLQKDNARLKHDVAELKRRVANLEQTNKKLVKVTEVVKKTASPSEDEIQKLRPTGAMIRRLRDKLNITQGDLGILLGVTGQSIYQWERKGGKLRLRKATLAALANVRKMGRREVVAILTEE